MVSDIIMDSDLEKKLWYSNIQETQSTIRRLMGSRFEKLINSVPPDVSYEKRVAVVEHILDELLHEYNHNLKVVRKVINHLYDQELLKKIAIRVKSFYVYEIAIKRITKQRLLIEICLSDALTDPKFLAIDKIHDNIALKQICMESQNTSVKTHALKRITDDEIVKEMIERFGKIAHAALPYVKDQDWLKIFYLDAKKPLFQRYRALTGIYDTEWLLQILPSEGNIPTYFCNYVKDEEFFKRAFDRVPHQFRYQVLKKIKDQEYLREYALNIIKFKSLPMFEAREVVRLIRDEKILHEFLLLGQLIEDQKLVVIVRGNLRRRKNE